MVRRLRPVLLFALLCACAAQSPAARAAEKKKATPVMAPAPPPAMPQTVQVTRGRKVEVPLRIFGRRNEALRYVIKTPPAHGTLSEPRVLDREASAITYEPPADPTVRADRFTFSVQSSVGVSAPVEVKITILDETPILTMPGVLDFGAVLAGTATAKEFELVNIGGGLAEGEIKVGPPWRVEGRANYRLATGETAILKVVFAPGEAGDFRSEIRYSSDLAHTTALQGSAAMPISLEPSTVVLRHEPGATLRTGVFEIVNRTTEPRTFRINGGARLQVEAEASVAPNGRLAVAVSTAEEDVLVLEDTVRVAAEGFEVRVPVRAAAVAPILRVVPRVDFGRLAAGRGGQLPLMVENVGGTPAAVTSEVAAPFALHPPALEIPVRSRREFALSIQPAAAGPYRGWLKLQTSAGVTEVEIEADLVESAGRPRSNVASARLVAARSGRQEAAARAAAEAASDKTLLPNTYIAKAVRVSALKPTSARLEWAANFGDAASFRIERRMLALDTAKELQTSWVPWPRVTFSRAGTQCVAQLSGLPPGQLMTLRIVPLDAAGQPGPRFLRVDFHPPPPRSALRLVSLRTALWIALAGCLGVLAWRRWRRPKQPQSGF